MAISDKGSVFNAKARFTGRVLNTSAHRVYLIQVLSECIKFNTSVHRVYLIQVFTECIKFNTSAHRVYLIQVLTECI